MRSRSSFKPCCLGTYCAPATRWSLARAVRTAAICSPVAVLFMYVEIVIWLKTSLPSRPTDALKYKKAPSSAMVTATVPIAVACIPALRVKLRKTSPRKNLILPQSKEIVASLFVGDDLAVLEPDDAPAHAVHDRLVVGGDDDGRSF